MLRYNRSTDLKGNIIVLQTLLAPEIGDDGSGLSRTRLEIANLEFSIRHNFVYLDQWRHVFQWRHVDFAARFSFGICKWRGLKMIKDLDRLKRNWLFSLLFKIFRNYQIIPVEIHTKLFSIASNAISIILF